MPTLANLLQLKIHASEKWQWFAFSFLYARLFDNNTPSIRTCMFQFVNSRGLILAGVGLIVSIAIFNWAGVSVTSYVNATFRMILGEWNFLLLVS